MTYKDLIQIGAKLLVKQRELPQGVSIINLNPKQEAMKIEYKSKMREEMESLRQTLEYFHEKCESPPELILYDAARRNGINLIPQYPVLGISGRQYWVDFAFVKAGYKTLAVEVISNEFHKDKEADRKREKDMEQIGIKVQGFSASRCLDHPEACAVEIKERLIRLGSMA